MSFLSGNALLLTLRKALGAQFNPDAIKQAAYQLSLGAEYFRTDADGQIETLDDKKKLIEINAGQFCLLLTEETVQVPNNLMAFISIKANEKFKGLINVSGFHLDPGFNGKILFSVYNAGPSTISLRRGEQYFLLWFCKLSEELSSEDAYSSKANIHQGQNGIPTRYIDALKRGELASPNMLLKKIEEVEHDFSKRYVRHEVIAGVLLTIAVGIGIKVFYNQKANEQGDERRIKHEALINEIMFGNRLLLSDTNFVKLDSLNNKIQRLKKTINLSSQP